MRWYQGRTIKSVTRSAASVAAFAAAASVLAGCSSGAQIDKYTVTDADRAAAKASLGPDGKPVMGAIPKDPHDSAAYGPEGQHLK